MASLGGGWYIWEGELDKSSSEMKVLFVRGIEVLRYGEARIRLTGQIPLVTSI